MRESHSESPREKEPCQSDKKKECLIPMAFPGTSWTTRASRFSACLEESHSEALVCPPGGTKKGLQ